MSCGNSKPYNLFISLTPLAKDTNLFRFVVRPPSLGRGRPYKPERVTAVLKEADNLTPKARRAFINQLVTPSDVLPMLLASIEQLPEEDGRVIVCALIENRVFAKLLIKCTPNPYIQEMVQNMPIGKYRELILDTATGPDAEEAMRVIHNMSVEETEETVKELLSSAGLAPYIERHLPKELLRSTIRSLGKEDAAVLFCGLFSSSVAQKAINDLCKFKILSPLRDAANTPQTQAKYCTKLHLLRLAAEVLRRDKS